MKRPLPCEALLDEANPECLVDTQSSRCRPPSRRKQYLCLCIQRLGRLTVVKRRELSYPFTRVLQIISGMTPGRRNASNARIRAKDGRQSRARTPAAAEIRGAKSRQYRSLYAATAEDSELQRLRNMLKHRAATTPLCSAIEIPSPTNGSMNPAASPTRSAF